EARSSCLHERRERSSYGCRYRERSGCCGADIGCPVCRDERFSRRALFHFCCAACTRVRYDSYPLSIQPTPTLIRVTVVRVMPRELLSPFQLASNSIERETRHFKASGNFQNVLGRKFHTLSAHNKKARHSCRAKLLILNGRDRDRTDDLYRVKYNETLTKSEFQHVRVRKT